MKIPALKGTRCTALLACGMLVGENAETLKKVKKIHKYRVALIPRGGARFVALFGGGDMPESKEHHLHIDVIAQNQINITRHPKLNSTIPQINALLNLFMGQEIRVDLTARFLIPLAELPSPGFVRSVVESKADTKVKQTGAKFDVEAGPITEIAWYLRGEKKELVSVELEATTTLKISDKYLEELYDLAALAFRLLILGETNNAKATNG